MKASLFHKKKGHATFLDRFEKLTLIFYSIIAGTYLITIPWSVNWQENFFFSLFPPLGNLGTHPALRGGISGIGCVLVVMGLKEIFTGLFGSSRRNGIKP